MSILRCLNKNRYKLETIFFQAIGGGLVRREGVWNLVFTDNNFHEFRYLTGDLQLNVSFTVLNMKTDICCRLIGEATCNCPSNFKVSFNFYGINLQTCCLNRKKFSIPNIKTKVILLTNVKVNFFIFSFKKNIF